MEFRNVVHNENGTFDCELLHYDFGWIPFTASKDDSEEHGRVLYGLILEAGEA